MTLNENDSGAAGRGVALSVVVPVYQCAGTIAELHARLTVVLSNLVGSYEIVFVDDRSTDGAWTILAALATRDPSVLAIRLSRNVGQQLAITAGLAQCSGDHAVVMDCDLQDPPEAIPALYRRASEGFDIVFARRKGAHRGIGRAIANRLFVVTLGLMCGRRFDGGLGAFSIVSRRVVQAFLQLHERGRHYLLLLLELGYDTTIIEYERDPRGAGKSSFGFVELWKHALAGVLFATNRPLYWPLAAGVALLAGGTLTGFVFAARWIEADPQTGWAAAIVAQLLIGGALMLGLGVNGLYLGQILQETRRRPLYFIQDRIDGRNIAQQQSGALERTAFRSEGF